MRVFFLILLLSSGAIGQNLHQRFDGIPFTIDGNISISPFNGGIDIPRYQFVDIDGDSDLDLFMIDKDTSLYFYKNDGSSSNHLFRLNTARYNNLSIRNWFQFADIDGNGSYDLFCGGDSQHVRYYKNFGSPSSPNFILQTYSVRTNQNVVIESESACIPTFSDIDADGDLDFFSGSSSGKVTFYKNIGSANSFSFQFATDEFAGINIQGGALDHGASSITFGDIDGDNDKDLYWGDLFGFSIYFIKNTGNAQNFEWTSIDTTSPEPNPYYSGGFNTPGICDIDGDGKNDFFIGVLIGSKTLDNFVYYRNNGPVNNPSFVIMTDNFILSADVGSYSYPTLGDIDNDGDKDLFIGCDRSVAFYRNTGSATQPAYLLETDSLPLSINNFNYAPAIGDLDGDGKKDMVLGYYASAKLKFFKNTGSLSTPVFTLQASQLDTMNLVQSSAPCLADLDNDSDLDLLVGTSGGKLTYYRNNGTAAAFNFQFITNNYMSINTGNDAAPSLGDVDGDGDMDLLVGNRLGQLYFYRNIGTQSSPNFVFETSSYAGINVFQNSVPCITDINNDGDIDLFMGNTKGGLYYYENWDVFGIQQIGNEIPAYYVLDQNYPNPFNPVTNIGFRIADFGFVSLKVYDITGREVDVLVNGELKPGIYNIDFDAGSLASGVYFYHLVAGDFAQVKKMVLVR